jgi:hypothetical protein
MYFQALEWSDYNENFESENTSGSDSESEFDSPAKYTIRIFGVTREGHSVCLTVTGMECYFYIKVPDFFSFSEKEKILDYIEYRLRDRFPKSLNRRLCKFVKYKDFYGFHYDHETKSQKLFNFLRISLNNSSAMRSCAGIFSNRVCIRSISSKEFKYPCYESNVDCMIRFIHNRGLQTSGWIYLAPKSYTLSDHANVQIDIQTNWDSVSQPDPQEIELGTAPFIQASFDIEAYSQFRLDKKVSVDSGSCKIKGHHTTFLSNLWAYFAASLVLILGKWLLYYGSVAQPILILTVVGYGLAALYYLDHHERLSSLVRRQFLFIMVAILVVVIAFSSWSDKTI